MNEIEERLRGDLFTATYDMEGDLDPDVVLAASHRARRVRTVRRATGVGAAAAVVAAVAMLVLPGRVPGNIPAVPVTDPNATATPWTSQGARTMTAAPTSVESAPDPLVPVVPDTAGAIAVATDGVVAFSSPSGRIWCTMLAGVAECRFPKGMDTSAVPAAADTCTELGLTVVAVSVEYGKAADYSCTSGPDPVLADPATDWWQDTGFPAVANKDLGDLAVLPYGKALTQGAMVCLSEDTGVVCGDSESGKGFMVSRAGVILIS